MLQAPTGFGKTILLAAVVDGALRKGKRVVAVVPALSLIDQMIAALVRAVESPVSGVHVIGVPQIRAAAKLS